MRTLSPRCATSTSLVVYPSKRQKTVGVFSPSKVSRLQMKLKAADEAHRGKPIWLAENSGPDKACPSLSTFSHAPIPLCCLHQNSISNHFVSEIGQLLSLFLWQHHILEISTTAIECVGHTQKMRPWSLPTAYIIHVSPPFLAVVCTLVPKIPLPTSIPRIPCVFTDNETVMPDLQGIVCQGPHMISDREDQLFELTPFTDRVEIIRELMSAGATEIGWLGTHWVILVESSDEETKSRLPRTLANLAVSYIPDSLSFLVFTTAFISATVPSDLSNSLYERKWKVVDQHVPRIYLVGLMLGSCPAAVTSVSFVFTSEIGD